MANTIVERGRCLHAVACDSVCESGSDLFLIRFIIDSQAAPSTLRSSAAGMAFGRDVTARPYSSSLSCLSSFGPDSSSAAAWDLICSAY